MGFYYYKYYSDVIQIKARPMTYCKGYVLSFMKMEIRGSYAVGMIKRRIHVVRIENVKLKVSNFCDAK